MLLISSVFFSDSKQNYKQWHWVQHLFKLTRFVSYAGPCCTGDTSLLCWSMGSQYQEWGSRKRFKKILISHEKGEFRWVHRNPDQGMPFFVIANTGDFRNEETVMSYVETIFIQCVEMHKHLDFEPSIIQGIVLHFTTAGTGGYGWRENWSK